MSRRTTERERTPADSSGRIKPLHQAGRQGADRPAAAVRGKTRPEFMLEASRRAAAEALSDTTPLRVDPETYARFIELLDKRPQPSDTLRRLLQQKAPWEA